MLQKMRISIASLSPKTIGIFILLSIAVGAIFKSLNLDFFSVQAASSPQNTPKLQALIPLYIYPQMVNGRSNWLPLVEAARKISVVAIINPNSGPGGKPNSDYVQGLKILQQGGVKTIGYVATNYGKRPIEQVKADVDLYNAHFTVQGIFLDEGASSPQQLNYYSEIYRYIKSKKKLQQVIVNPGTHIDEAYFSKSATDQAVIFENFGKEWPTYQPSIYVNKYERQRFALMLHGVVDRAKMQSYIELAVKRNIGYVYITNDTDSNPWDSLPSYWSAEVEAIRSQNLAVR
jgi:Spherulation-specific family 4